MLWIDWLVLISVLLFIIIYGVWKTRKTNTAEDFLAGHKSNWWMVGLSIMATQASAITFLSTPGQAYFDGLGFVQFYFGLPLAVILLSIIVVPRFFKIHVFTAYEYLEKRFGLPTRVLTALLFLLQRGLAAGITIFAPAIILSSILGWSLNSTILIIGTTVIIYTLVGGTEAVNQTQKQQMFVIFFGMLAAFITIIHSLPIGLDDALSISGHLGKLEAVNFSFDLNNRYNIWSAFLGGTFLFLSYFGTDQSQVQRYLSAQNLKEARLGLLFNGLFKVPMQFFILLTGIMVFVFFQFNASPVNFNPNAQQALQNNNQFQNYQKQQDRIVDERIDHLKAYAQSDKNGQQRQEVLQSLTTLQNQENKVRSDARRLIRTDFPEIEHNDKDYVFIHFILHYLPHGLIGLLVAVILSAAMSSTSSELNALATTTVVDIYKRLFKPNINDKDYLLASRLFTLLWGCIAIFFALKASLFENLIQAVNIIGSLFYGVILGVFSIAFLLPKIKGQAVLYAILLVEPIVILLYYLQQKGYLALEFLWLNPIGCLLLVIVASIIQKFSSQPTTKYTHL